jgi:hypothetical protein
VEVAVEVLVVVVVVVVPRSGKRARWAGLVEVEQRYYGTSNHHPHDLEFKLSFRKPNGRIRFSGVDMKCFINLVNEHFRESGAYDMEVSPAILLLVCAGQVPLPAERPFRIAGLPTY